MSDEFRHATFSRKPGEEPLLWITGCCVGAAHPPSLHSAESLAWYALEQSGEAALLHDALDRSRHR